MVKHPMAEPWTLWMPIETAPKDGTPVDLWCKRSWSPPETHERSADMYWCTTHNRWRWRDHPHFVDEFWTPSSERHLIPTRWMPIPVPPQPYEDDGLIVAHHARLTNARLAEQALREAERFMAYFAGETGNTFVGPGTPKTCLELIRNALRG